MEEFNIEKAKNGFPVCTRDGRKVRILCFDRKTCEPQDNDPIFSFDDGHCIVALVSGHTGKYENVETYFPNGMRYKHTTSSDLVMKDDVSNVTKYLNEDDKLYLKGGF